MKKLFPFILSFALFACSNVTATPNVTVTSQVTAAATLPPSPTLTATATSTLIPDTATPDTVLPPIETVPFNKETYKNLPELDVAKWEAEAGRALTPKDIIEASRMGDAPPFPSDALVVGFRPEKAPDGSITMVPNLSGEKVKVDKLPMTYEAVMLKNIKDKLPKKVLEIAEKEGLEVNKLLAVIWRTNTPSGELMGVMITDGHMLMATGGRKVPHAQDLLEGTGVVSGKEDWMMTVMTEMPPGKGADVIGSVVAEEMWKEERVIQRKIQEVMTRADLKDEEDLENLQKLFDENWLYMGGITDEQLK